MAQAVPGSRFGAALKLHFRVLTFQATREELAGLNATDLALGLVWTWVVGIGRWWDDPDAYVIQRLGVGSLIYVFVFALVLWLAALPLRPQDLTYRRTLTYVTLTSPPALLYAIPVERWYGVDVANQVNAWFLAIVALWRVGLYYRLTWRGGHLPWLENAVGMMVPITIVIVMLFQLNLERSTFEIMAGLRQTTSADLSYQWLMLLSVLSVVSMWVVIPAYLICAVRRYLQARHEREARRERVEAEDLT